ncbi:hypothetical protein AB07_2407 [Citrobacter freundii]|nr:hypothetical protein SF123566_9002 [Shigella flexneri 1235-66]KEL79802.1 hypothetical protein AB07_2407 [Citrobacter freundii]
MDIWRRRGQGRLSLSRAMSEGSGVIAFQETVCFRCIFGVHMRDT